MAQLRQDYKEFVVRNTEVLIVSPEDSPEVAAFWRRSKICRCPAWSTLATRSRTEYGQEVKLLQLGPPAEHASYWIAAAQCASSTEAAA